MKNTPIWSILPSARSCLSNHNSLAPLLFLLIFIMTPFHIDFYELMKQSIPTFLMQRCSHTRRAFYFVSFCRKQRHICLIFLQARMWWLTAGVWSQFLSTLCWWSTCSCKFAAFDSFMSSVKDFSVTRPNWKLSWSLIWSADLFHPFIGCTLISVYHYIFICSAF